MRVIAGKYARRNLYALKSRQTRPTSAKVKESLFDSLGQFFQGGHVLDLYAGSGALGIEAVSRGCSHAVLIDINRAAVAIIQKNIALTKEKERFSVYKMNSKKALLFLAAHQQSFDLVFLDPPYAKQKIKEDMQQLIQLALLRKEAKIVAETDEQTEIGDVAGFSLLKQHHLGRTRVRIYQRIN